MQKIDKQTIAFLNAIGKNNNREWYHAHKTEYQAAKANFEAFTNEVIDAIREPAGLGGITAKQCMFRIQRDVRFSKDKTPYNSHFSAYMAPGGKKSKLGGFFFRVKPDGESVVGGGVWMPKGPDIAAIRQEIDYCGDEFHAIIDAPKFKKRFGQMEGDQLKRPPKGYEENHPDMLYLKHKSFFFKETVGKKTYASSNFQDHIVMAWHDLAPFLQFMNRAIGEEES